MPAQAPVGPAVAVGVADRHLQDGVRGGVEPSGFVVDALDHQGEEVEGGAGSAGPAELEEGLGQRGVAGVADGYGGVVAVAGVPDELLAPDQRPRPVRGLRGEDGDGGPDAAAVRRLAQVVEALGGDRVGVGEPAAVADPQRVPVEPAYTAVAVAPGHARSVGQLGGRVHVGTGVRELRPHGGEPGARITRAGVLPVEESDELLGRLPHLCGGGALLKNFHSGGLPPVRPDPPCTCRMNVQ